MIEDLWAERDLQQPANALQVVVFKPSATIGADRIVTRPPGYLLDVADDDVDALRFERLAREGREALAGGRASAAVACFEGALGLWRDGALIEFVDVPMAVAAASRWEELRESVTEDRFDALLTMGRHADLVSELDTAIAGAPFRERLRGQLMLALYRSGRQTEALRAYADARHLLADELGLEPSTDLRRLEAAILAQDPSLEAPPATDVAVGTSTRRRRPPGRGADQPAARVDDVRRPRRRHGRRGRTLLAEHRLATLVGAGGLRQDAASPAEFAAGHLDEYPGGVWFVALDTVGSDAAVVPTLAAALGLSSADGVAPPASPPIDDGDRIRGFLADRTRS